MKNIYTVSQINYYIKDMFAQDYLLCNVSVRGEVSNCKYHTSGHIYFSLKDESAAISCIVFASSRSGVKLKLTDGQKIVATGRIGTYERGGTYQLYVTEAHSEGLGELYVRYEALKNELEEMGMFSPIYKKPLPKYINTLGVVTAPTGAAIRDIIQISRRRYPGIQIVLYPAKVQGEGSAESIVAGISALSEYGVDVMIVGRGGGSMEDLWAFNERIVAEAIFECDIPVISAVGHETDTVISDFVADLRAPTPSAAAELAVADMRETVAKLREYHSLLSAAMYYYIDRNRDLLEKSRMRIELKNPASSVLTLRHRLLAISDELNHVMEAKLASQRALLEKLKAGIEAMSPYEKLSSGYAYVSGSDERRIVRAADVSVGDELTLRFSDGSVKVRVVE